MNVAGTLRGPVSPLAKWSALGGSLTVQRKAATARRVIRSWLDQCSAPAICCGGGKDSTALLELVRSVDPSVPAVRADPPNPLPDRTGHVARLKAASGGEWIEIPYSWDVDAVLEGDERYPYGLKVRRMLDLWKGSGVDGVALGVRSAESKARRERLRRTGEVYRWGGITYCAPLASWTAEEVVGFTLHSNRLPLNPVYENTALAPPLNQIRDGTWWPRASAHRAGYGDFIVAHYPSVAPLYRRAISMAIEAETALWPRPKWT